MIGLAISTSCPLLMDGVEHSENYENRKIPIPPEEVPLSGTQMSVERHGHHSHIRLDPREREFEIMRRHDGKGIGLRDTVISSLIEQSRAVDHAYSVPNCGWPIMCRTCSLSEQK